MMESRRPPAVESPSVSFSRYTDAPFTRHVHFNGDDSNNSDDEEETNNHAPSPLPFAISSNNLNIDSSSSSSRDVVRQAQHHVSASVTSLFSSLDKSRSISLSVSEAPSYDDRNDDAAAEMESPGITILDDNEDDDEPATRKDCDAQQQITSSIRSTTSQSNTSNRAAASSSFFQTQIIDDSIILGAAAHVDANSPGDHRNSDASSILNQLMQYANNDNDEEGCYDYFPRLRDENNTVDRGEGKPIDDDNNNNTDEDDFSATSSSARRNMLLQFPISFVSSLLLSFAKKNKMNQRTSTSGNITSNVPSAALTNPSRSPIRAHRIRHDKYIVEVDIMPLIPLQQHLNYNNDSSVNIRDAIDVLANVDLLHLWFEPIPAIFDVCTKDGGGGGGGHSPANSISSSSETNNNENINNNNHNNVRQYDGEWIEITSSLLVLPSDAHLSSCLRAIHVGLRKLIGFPVRVRSRMFVERHAGRVGVTLGPYPDRSFRGTMAHHTFNVNVVTDVEEEEEIGVRGGGVGMVRRQKIVITDEVRLQKEGDDNSNGKRNGYYCYCALFRILFHLLEWITVLWYQPDLASYMAQTISSMEKLRTLIERGGETTAYHGEELVMEEDDWGDGGADNVNSSIRTALLG
jgi:hypothetical protein